MPLMPAFKARRQVRKFSIPSLLLTTCTRDKLHSWAAWWDTCQTQAHTAVPRLHSLLLVLLYVLISVFTTFMSVLLHLLTLRLQWQVLVCLIAYCLPISIDKNKFSMPLIMTAEAFAAYVQKVLIYSAHVNKSRGAIAPSQFKCCVLCPFLPFIQSLAADEPIVAPFLAYFGVWLLHCIPPALSSALMQRAPKKGGSRPSSSTKKD